LYFAQQIPRLAKSQTERLTLPKEEGIQESVRADQPKIAAGGHKETRTPFCLGRGALMVFQPRPTAFLRNWRPDSLIAANRRGINRTDWWPTDKATYDA
jgi:hypothetical protein